MTRLRPVLSVAIGTTLAALSFIGCSSSDTEERESAITTGAGGKTGSSSSATTGGTTSGSGGNTGDPTTTGSTGSGTTTGTTSTTTTGTTSTTVTTGGSGGMGGSAAGGGGDSQGGGGRSGGGGTGGSRTDGGMPPQRDSGTPTGDSSTGGGGVAGKSAGCGKMPTIASNMYNNGKNIPITAASMQRRYILSVPTNYDNTKPYKLIIAWHQLDGNDNQMYRNQYYHLQPLSDNTTIFVAPNGQKGGAPCSGTGNGESGVRMAELKRLRHGARRCRRGRSRSELLYRHEPDLRNGVELRRQHVVPERRASGRSAQQRLRPRHRRVLGIATERARSRLHTEQTGRVLRLSRDSAIAC